MDEKDGTEIEDDEVLALIAKDTSLVLIILEASEEWMQDTPNIGSEIQATSLEEQQPNVQQSELTFDEKGLLLRLNLLDGLGNNVYYNICK